MKRMDELTFFEFKISLGVQSGSGSDPAKSRIRNCNTLFKAVDQLKGLSHEIDFKNFNKNLQNLV